MGRSFLCSRKTFTFCTPDDDTKTERGCNRCGTRYGRYLHHLQESSNDGLITPLKGLKTIKEFAALFQKDTILLTLSWARDIVRIYADFQKGISNNIRKRE